MSLVTPKRALISVSDKAGVVDLCRFLHEKDVELISTGGTAKVLEENNIPYLPIEKVTGNPEAFGGRMKTISFEIGSALLFRRANLDDQKQAKELKINPIDIVVCNLYPFEKTAREKKPLPDLIENIDIGGPTMVRAAAKNFESVACITDPEDYPKIKSEIEQTGGLSLDTRKELSLKTFVRIAAYDLSIAIELTKQMGDSLRYGENPHQTAALLKINNTDSKQTLADAKFLQGKELSYNNLLDADQAYKCASELQTQFKGDAVCVIVKHGIPCGVGVHADLFQALNLAWEADSISAFGGILCFNQQVTETVAQFIKERFVEVIIAPKYSPRALEILSAKKNVRVLETPLKDENTVEWTTRSINGGILCQDEDRGISSELKSVTKKAFPDSLQSVSRLGLVVSKYLKSNCIGIFARKNGGITVLASGVGQPNRLDCISILIQSRLKAKSEKLDEAVLVSDAFFPFRDSIEAAHQIGVHYIVQPGGSIKDQEVIAACDEFNIAMLMTGKRHFRH